jgi:NAD+ kinase
MTYKYCFLASNSEKAQDSKKYFLNRYSNYDVNECDIIIALGGDGFLLETFHMLSEKNLLNKSIYGINCGTVGFMLNRFTEEDLNKVILDSNIITINPLKIIVETISGDIIEKYAFNYVQIYRRSGQAIKFEVKVNGRIRIPELVGDGILFSTPSGSTSYNLSAGGSIVPIGSNVLPLTPICAFRPKGWKGALLSHSDYIELTLHESEKRPASASADYFCIHDIKNLKSYLDKTQNIKLLFRKEDCLAEKIFSEQFPY